MNQKKLKSFLLHLFVEYKTRFKPYLRHLFATITIKKEHKEHAKTNLIRFHFRVKTMTVIVTNLAKKWHLFFPLFGPRFLV